MQEKPEEMGGNEIAFTLGIFGRTPGGAKRKCSGSRSDEGLVPADTELNGIIDTTTRVSKSHRTAATACSAAADVYALDGNSDGLQSGWERYRYSGTTQVTHDERCTQGLRPRGTDALRAREREREKELTSDANNCRFVETTRDIPERATRGTPATKRLRSPVVPLLAPLSAFVTVQRRRDKEKKKKKLAESTERCLDCGFCPTSIPCPRSAQSAIRTCQGRKLVSSRKNTAHITTSWLETMRERRSARTYSVVRKFCARPRTISVVTLACPISKYTVSTGCL